MVRGDWESRTEEAIRFDKARGKNSGGGVILPVVRGSIEGVNARRWEGRIRRCDRSDKQAEEGD